MLFTFPIYPNDYQCYTALDMRTRDRLLIDIRCALPFAGYAFACMIMVGLWLVNGEVGVHRVGAYPGWMDRGWF